MIFVCDRNGPVDKDDIGLLNNPETLHRAGQIERTVALWNRIHPERELKIFRATNGFPFDRWDAELFDLLPVARVEIPAGGDPGGGQGGGGTPPELCVEIFNARGDYTWAVPSGVASCFVKVIGGGAGGSQGHGGGNNIARGGGGGGGVAEKLCDLRGLSSVAVTVGKGGTGKKGGGIGLGETGGTSRFGDFCHATGGEAGQGGNVGSPGGVGVGGDVNYGLGDGHAPINDNNNGIKIGGHGGGPGGRGAMGAAAGGSAYVISRPGQGPGGGGGSGGNESGGQSDASDGADGAVYIWYVKGGTAAGSGPGAARVVQIGGQAFEIQEAAVIGYFNQQDPDTRLQVSLPHGIAGNIKSSRRILNVSLSVYDPWTVNWTFPQIETPVMSGSAWYLNQLQALLPYVVYVDDSDVTLARKNNPGTGEARDIYFVVKIEYSSEPLPFPDFPGAPPGGSEAPW